MALREVTNIQHSTTARKKDFHVRILNEYAPIKNEHLSTQEKQRRRQQGHTNLDLWVQGDLYPNDPSSHYPPLFSDIPSFLQFVGEGENGLLGYCKRLNMSDDNTVKFLHAHLQSLYTNLDDTQSSLQSAQNHILQLEDQAKAKEKQLEKLKDTISRMKITPMGARERKRPFTDIQALAMGGGARKRRVLATRYGF